jgi:hypothetical protein
VSGVSSRKKGERGGGLKFISQNQAGEGAIFLTKKIKKKNSMTIPHKKGVFQNLGRGTKNHGLIPPPNDATALVLLGLNQKNS